jgi:ABC-type phosphate/phosphonate transport system substrate-binding protein
MYAVTPEVEAGWRALLAHVSEEAGVPLSYVSYPAPQPLELLWRRTDLGAVFMCGYPVALELAPVVPIAAPIPLAEWAGGRAVYRTNLIVRADAPYGRLEDSFGARAGYTVAHSQSGFNAFRHHLLRYRRPERPALYASMTGNLIAARGILDAVANGQIDIGPLDAYWHLLLEHAAPEATRGVRVLATTELTPIPTFVASAGADAAMVAALRAAFLAAATRPWFESVRELLQLAGFAHVSAAEYAIYLDWDREAQAAGYPLPA